MNDLADSRRNMKIDLRPRVLMRLMRFEIVIALFSLTACVSFPTYFYYVKPYMTNFN